ncbi:MAG: DNA internalization-related competence protein ComEC/Rec2 [Oliverpabstia sp.]|nr:DNA internalization-related competence protein ComEC/Rec2 [Oliverpabstia sp.]
MSKVKRPMCLAACILAFVIILADLLGISWIWRSPAGRVPDSEREKITAQGEVYDQEEQIYTNQVITYLYLKHTSLYVNGKTYPIRNIKCYIEGSQENFLGECLSVTGTLEVPEEPGNPGEFNRRRYEQARKIDYYLKKCRIGERSSEQQGFAVLMAKCRNYFSGVLESIFPEQEAGVLEAMLLGEKKLLEDEVQSGFQAAGISHVIAISGLHISMLGAALWSAMQWVGFPIILNAAVSCTVLLGYGVLINNPATAVRAVIMFLVMIGARLFGRAYDLLSALSLAAILLLVDNPDLLFSGSFQLSFAAVVAMGTYVAQKRELLRMLFPGKRWMETAGTGLALWISMLPVSLSVFSQVSMVGILCNLVVLPLMPLVLGSGFTALILGCWSCRVGSIAGIPAYGLVKLFEATGTLVEKISWGVWTPGNPSIVIVVICYILLGLELVLEKRISRRIVQAALSVWIPAAVILILSAPWKNVDSITVLDVGQGDGIVLRSGKVQILVDGGSTSRSQVGKYVLLPYLKHEGISVLEGIFLTHTDEDHMNGAKEVLEEAQKGWLTVQQVFFPVWMAQTEEGKEILRLAEQCGASCRTLQTGDSLCMGNAMIRILHPGTGDYSQDPNGGSLVFEWECDGIRALFTGDLPLEQEEGLLDRVRPCTFLKAAHHGSNGSTSEQFLEKASPKAVWISCGINNRYGHPGEETMERLKNYGAEIFRTDQQGALILSRKSNTESWGLVTVR